MELRFLSEAQRSIWLPAHVETTSSGEVTHLAPSEPGETDASPNTQENRWHRLLEIVVIEAVVVIIIGALFLFWEQSREEARLERQLRSDFQVALSTLSSLTDINLPGVDLQGLSLNGRDLSGANLQGADLRDTDLRNTIFVDADLRDADMRGAKLSSANFEGALLDGADLGGATASRTSFRGATLRDADLDNVEFDLVAFAGTDLSGASFVDAKLDIGLNEANLSGTSFERTVGLACIFGALWLADDPPTMDLTEVLRFYTDGGDWIRTPWNSGTSASGGLICSRTPLDSLPEFRLSAPSAGEITDEFLLSATEFRLQFVGFENCDSDPDADGVFMEDCQDDLR